MHIAMPILVCLSTSAYPRLPCTLRTRGKMIKDLPIIMFTHRPCRRLFHLPLPSLPPPAPPCLHHSHRHGEWGRDKRQMWCDRDMSHMCCQHAARHESCSSSALLEMLEIDCATRYRQEVETWKSGQGWSRYLYNMILESAWPCAVQVDTYTISNWWTKVLWYGCFPTGPKGCNASKQCVSWLPMPIKKTLRCLCYASLVSFLLFPGSLSSWSATQQHLKWLSERASEWAIMCKKATGWECTWAKTKERIR